MDMLCTLSTYVFHSPAAVLAMTNSRSGSCLHLDVLRIIMLAEDTTDISNLEEKNPSQGSENITRPVNEAENYASPIFFHYIIRTPDGALPDDDDKFLSINLPSSSTMTIVNLCGSDNARHQVKFGY